MSDALIAKLREAAEWLKGEPDCDIPDGDVVMLDDAERIVREGWPAARLSKRLESESEPTLAKIVRDTIEAPAARECVYTEDVDGVWLCSACKWDVSDDLTESTWAYCPHCGARITESRAYKEDDDVQ